ncbi:hypothetical protein H1R20_g8374, partial [Candolleomyces eurysporus]
MSTNTGNDESKPLVSCLPPDIYKEIIETIMNIREYQDRGPRRKKQLVILSHISPPFRHAVLDCPTLWSSALDPEDPHPTAFEHIYARTKDVPLQVDSHLRTERDRGRDSSELARQSNARIKKLLLQTHRLSHLSLSWSSTKDDLPFILDALAKPVTQLSHVRLCSMGGFGTPLDCLPLQRRLFEEDGVSNCSLSFRNCYIDPTLVSLPKLVVLNVNLTPSSSRLNSLSLLLRWWGIVMDGSSTPALEELKMRYFNIGDPSYADTDTAVTTGFSGHRSFPPHLKKLELDGTLNSYIHLFDDDSPLPESCTNLVLECDGVYTDPADAHMVENMARKLSRLVAGVWKNSNEATAANTTKLCPRTDLHISGQCHYELTLTFSSGLDRKDGEDRHSSLSFRDCYRNDHANGLALFTKGVLQVDIPKLTPDAWLDMYLQCSPDFALHIHDAYVGFMKQLDGLRNLHLKCSRPFHSLMVQADNGNNSDSGSTVTHPCHSSSSSNSNSPNVTVLLPNLHHVRLEHWWLCDPAAVLEFNQFDAARTRLGLPIPRVEVRMMHRSGPDRDIVVHRPLKLGEFTPVKVQPDGRVTADKPINLFGELRTVDEYLM